MIDDIDWRLERAELDAILAAHRHSSLPPGVLDRYIAGVRRRMKLVQAEIDEVFEAAAHDPALMARLNQRL